MLGQWGGLVPATFAVVFIAALGDRQNTLLGSAVLGVVMTGGLRPGVLVVVAGAVPICCAGAEPMISQSLNDLWHGFGVALLPSNLLWSFVGVLIGNLIGVLPGMGALSAISMLLPLTYTMAPVPAILMLAGIFYGSQYGGAIGAILLNLPCHPPARGDLP